MQWMIYGANGYTGELIARQAQQQGLRPILAGRNETAIRKLAEELDLSARVFDVDDQNSVYMSIQDVDLVLNCAGPFEVTAQPMMEACIANFTHYLDITGEISVFERARKLHRPALVAGVVVCPGVGFDVIPTDCIAAQLKQRMPDATHLALGFDSESRMSRGTAKTGINQLYKGGAVRADGRITNVPLAYRSREIDFGGGTKLAMTIPWGDISTAFHTTGIENIEVYVPASKKVVKRLQRLNKVRCLLGLDSVKNWLNKKVEKQPIGPDQQQLDHANTYVWGEVKNAAGAVETLQYKVMNGYKLTSLGAIDVAMTILRNQPSGGYHTPSQLCGADLINNYRVE